MTSAPQNCQGYQKQKKKSEKQSSLGTSKEIGQKKCSVIS